MATIAYPGSALNVVHRLTVDYSVLEKLELDDDWVSPTKMQFLDPESGVVFFEDLLDNPQPIINGSSVSFEYFIEFLVPDIPRGLYDIVLTRHTVSSSQQVTVDGVVTDAYGAEDILCLNTDNDVIWGLKDHNPNAKVDWELNFVRITSEVAKIPGITETIPDGSDMYFVSTPPFVPMNEGVKPSFNPIPIVWTIKDSPVGIHKRKLISSLYVVNLSQLTAINELKSFFDRLMEEKRLPSLEYSMADYCRWMKQGMDMFNGGGIFTTFDMTNATDAIRYWWFNCSIICALRNMYMLEGQRSFNFSGQSVSLDINVTEYIQSVMSDLTSQWDSEKQQFKTQLRQYGLTGGTGDMSLARLQIGALGLSYGPASNFAGFFGARNLMGGLRFFG